MIKRQLNKEDLQTNIKNVKLSYLGFGGTVGLIGCVFLAQSEINLGKESSLFILIASTLFLMFALVGVWNLGILALTNPNPIKFFFKTLVDDFKSK